MKNLIYCSFLLIMGLWACESAPTAKTETTTEVKKETPETLAANDKNVVRPTASSYVGDIPVYDTFADIAPVFNQSSDTTYVINFWATWCKPCVAELPYFEQIVSEYQDEKVQVILVSLDFKKQLESKLLPFLTERKLQSEVMVLADGKYNNWIDKVDADWGGAIPATVIYNAQERLFFGEQFANYEELNELVKQILNT